MLDIRYVRENADIIRHALQVRGSSWDLEGFLRLDESRRALIREIETLQAKRNETSKAVGQLMKEGKPEEAEASKAAVREINAQTDEIDARLKETQQKLDDLLLAIPNLPHESVPVGADEDENVEIRRWGTPRVFDFEPQAHWDLGPALGIIDFERGVKLARSRFALLAGRGAQLERALINFMLDTHADAGFKEFWPPSMANKDVLLGTGQLPKFEDDLFKTTDGLYLIPTAEAPLTNIHREEVLEADTLPRHYTAFTSCFREEAGSAGRDTRGMIRMHQFDKVEMVKIVEPSTSFDELESMTLEAEKILQLLEIPYRVIELCTGDLGFAAAKTYDIEVWLPSYDNYKEISSCSNCTDFQARRASIKYRDPKQFKGSHFVHTLNGSGLAVGRTLAALIENYQEADGSVTIPEVLRPYMRGLSLID